MEVQTSSEDGVPAQVESVLNFSFNTRAYGPPDVLTDGEARRLATNIVNPEFPPSVASGSTCNIRVAVDPDGNVIEIITDDCAPGLSQVCLKAIGKWQFRPILQDGKAFPYRAAIVFRVP